VPDIVILDISMPEPEWRGSSEKKIRKISTNTEVLIFVDATIPIN